MKRKKTKRKKLHGRKMVAMLLILTFILGSVSGMIPAEQTAHAEQEARARMQNANKLVNDYIGLFVYKNGQFGMGTTGGNPENAYDDNRALLYGYSEELTSSATSFCIDGKVYGYGAPRVKFDEKNARNYSELEKGNVLIKQTLTFVKNSVTGREDVVEIKYLIKNISDIEKKVGCRIMLDTMLGENDDAPFRVPGIGAVTTETELEGDDIPQLWQVFDALDYPSVIAQGRFYRKKEECPDKVQFANWRRLVDYLWELKINKGSEIGDSAVAATWYEKPLQPGETREYKTYYGLSDLTQDASDSLLLSAYSESELEVSGTEYAPNPFPVTVYIENTGSETIEHAKVSLELPEGLSLVKGSEGTIEIGELKRNSIQQESWQVEAKPVGEEKDYKVTVILEYGAGEKKSVTRTVHVPALNIKKKKEVPKALGYTLFSESGEKNLSMYGWQSYITGNIYSGKDYSYQGSILNVTGKVDAVGKVTANGWQIHMDEGNEGTEPLEMPDLSEEIAKKAGEPEVYEESKSFTADKTTIEHSIYSKNDISFGSTTFEGSGYIMAEGNISCGVNQGGNYNDGKVVMYAKNGNITLNGSELSFDGILYAPNGTVSVNANIFRLRGRIFAKHIVMNTSQNYIEGEAEDIRYIFEEEGEEELPEPAATPEPTAMPTAEPAIAPTATPEPTIEPTETPEATSAPEPTATLEPTATPEPTATLEPTATPEPTVTLEPTATPESAATPEPTIAPTPVPTWFPEPTIFPQPTLFPSPTPTATPEPEMDALGALCMRRQKAVDWLKAQADENGIWQDAGLLNRTCDAVNVLRQAGETVESAGLEQWLAGKEGFNIDEQCHAVMAEPDEELMEKIWSQQNEDGGFGLTETYESDPYDTLLVMEAERYMQETGHPAADMQKQRAALSYLGMHRNADGGFGYSEKDASRVGLTVEYALIVRKMGLRMPEGDALYSYLQEHYTGDFSEPAFAEQGAFAFMVLRDGDTEEIVHMMQGILAAQGTDGSVYGDERDTILFIRWCTEVIKMAGGE